MSQNYSINDFDRNVLIPAICSVFKFHPESWWKSDDIIFFVNHDVDCNLSPGKFRVLMHEIRVQGLIKNIIASSNGYKVASTTAEMQQYLSDLHHRAMEIHELHGALKKQAEEVFGRQLIIETI